MYKVVAGHPTQFAIGSAFTLGGSDTVKCVITESGDPPQQTLTVFVAGTSRLSTGTIDDVWSAGKVGLVHIEGTSAITFDDFRVGYDNNADNDIDDDGDDLQIDDNFASTSITLTYDDNGKLTADGIFKFVYDAWNP